MNFLKFSLAAFCFLTLSCCLMAQDIPDLESYIRDNNIKVEQDDNGIAFVFKNKAGKKKAEIGDYVLIHYKAMRLDSLVFDESPEKDGFVFQVGYRQVIQGLDKGVLSLSEGQKATLFVPSELAYGKHGVGKTIKPGMDLRYEIEVAKILSDQEYDDYIVALEKKEKAAFDKHVREQFLKDKKAIQDYALAHKLKAKRTPSGLSYFISKEGKGDFPVPGDVLDVEYEGFLTDDTRFETSETPKVHNFKLGIGKVIPGWDEGLTFFREGSEGFLLIPSALAYGPREIQEENINIPADAVLIFKIKLLKITKGQKTTY